MELVTKILKWMVMGLLIAMIFPAVSCRDNAQEDPDTSLNVIPHWNAGGGKANIYFPRWIEGDVILSEEGYFIVLTDSMPYVESVSNIRVLRIRDKGLGEFPMDEDWPITDFSPYVGKHIVFCGMVKKMPEEGEQIIHVDGKEIPVTSHLAQITSVPVSKTRSNNTWEGEVSEEEYNWLKNLAMNTRASSNSITSPNFYVYVHVLRTPDGTGHSKESVCSTIMNNLQKYYASRGVHFKLLGSKYHDVLDSFLKDYGVYEEGKNRIYSLADNPNAIDVFIVSKCAYKVGKDSICGDHKHIPGTACIIYNESYKDYTVAHEIGHCLGLLHTHCCTSEDPKGHHTPLKELVDGSNSAYAGDLITDTPADPEEWDEWGRYKGTGTDANGQHYDPDPKNLMSHSGIPQYITPKQYERILAVTNAANGFNKILVRKIKDRQHLPTSGSISIENIQPEDRVEWTVNVYKGFPSTLVNTLKSDAQSYTYSPSESHYFTANAKVFLESGDTISLATRVTTGPPDPSFGYIVWESTNTNQYGSTSAQNYGPSLSVSKDTDIKLEYNDPIFGSLPDVNFMCVTATRRVLSGRNWTLTKADCANGFLKIRASDGCGSSNDYFTLETSVSGSYYAVDFTDDAICFEARTSSGSKVRQSLKSSNSISKIEIMNQTGSIVYSATSENPTAISIPKVKLSAGDYTAIIYNGESKEEIPFAV